VCCAFCPTDKEVVLRLNRVYRALEAEPPQRPVGRLSNENPRRDLDVLLLLDVPARRPHRRLYPPTGRKERFCRMAARLGS